MPRVSLFLVITVLVGGAACPAPAIHWSQVAYFRSQPRKSSSRRPRRAAFRWQQGKDYFRIFVEYVELRRIPGICDSGPALVTLRIKGLGPQGIAIEGVLEPKRCVGPEGVLAFDHPLDVDWWAYGGGPLEVVLSVRPLSPSAGKKALGAYQGLRRIARWIRPYDASHLRALKGLVARLNRLQPRPAWRIAFRWHPLGPKSGKVAAYLLSARHLVVLGAPGRPVQMKGVKLRGRRLILAKKLGATYSRSPYVIIRLEHAPIAPEIDTRQQRLLRDATSSYRRGAYARALIKLKEASEALAVDRFLTTRDRALVRGMIDLRRLQIQLADARAKRKRTEVARLRTLVREHLARILQTRGGDLPRDTAGSLRYELRRVSREIRGGSLN